MQDWRPCATNRTLAERAALLAGIRAFFAARGVLEVDTPQLCAAANPDPALDSFRVPAHGREWFLATSPEFAMKRLLAAGLGDIYQLAHVFRAGEAGRQHNPEFMLLEWYRRGATLEQVMDETVALVQSVGDGRLRLYPVHRVEYRDLFCRTLGVDPIDASLQTLRDCAHAQPVPAPALSDDHNLWLDWLMGVCVQPALPAGTLTLVSGYPAAQAALAELREDGVTAHRCELFCGPLELANGYRELSDSAEQRTRFEAEIATRRARGLAEFPLDERLLSALPHLPPCSGVALGVDRLAMQLLGAQHLEEVLSFTADNA